MAKEKEPRTASEFLDRLSEFLTDRPEESAEELRERLRNEGVDPDRVTERIRQLVATRSKEIRLGWQEKARQEREAAAERLKDVRGVGGQSRREIIERIRAMLTGQAGPRPALGQAYFRKIEEMTENDLRSLLDDLERAQRLGKEGG